MEEIEIRPKDLWEEYKFLCKKDGKTFFADCQKVHIKCPACQSNSVARSFEKDGFQYEVCSKCLTLYVNPRPLEKYFNQYYMEGESLAFWCNVLFPKVEKARKEKIFLPRVKRIIEQLELFDRYSLPISLIDIGSGNGSFLELAKEAGLASDPEGIEPNQYSAEKCRLKGFKIYEDVLEKIGDFKKKYKLAVSFEVLEHLYSPEIFIKKVFNILDDNSIFLTTSLSANGYDIKLLDKYHDIVKPPHHINFFNPDSVKRLFYKCGFKEVVVETPGQLDINILCNRVKEYPFLLKNTLFNHIYHSTTDIKNSFQEFIADNKLSSHMWIWGIK